MVKGYRTSRRVLRDELGFSEPFAGDKKARGQGLGAAQTASGTAAGYGGAAQGVASTLVPEYTQEAKNPTGINPTDLNAMQVASQTGAGGAAGALMGTATDQAARSRNSGALAGTLDQIARNKTQAAAGGNLAIQNMNTQEKLRQKQEGLKGLEGLYGTDVGAQLQAEGIVPKDLEAVAKADESGWQQDLQGWMKALSGGAQGAAALGLKIP
jgi:hypothetical protein